MKYFLKLSNPFFYFLNSICQNYEYLL